MADTDSRKNRVLRDLERRKSHRVELTVPVEVCLEGEEERRRVTIQNAGLNGVLIYFDFEVKVPLRFAVFWPRGQGRTLNLEAELVWAGEPVEEGVWPAGAAFKDMTPRLRERLAELIAVAVTTGPEF